jgi:hypothetical protein
MGKISGGAQVRQLPISECSEEAIYQILIQTINLKKCSSILNALWKTSKINANGLNASFKVKCLPVANVHYDIRTQ